MTRGVRVLLVALCLAGAQAVSLREQLSLLMEDHLYDPSGDGVYARAQHMFASSANTLRKAKVLQQSGAMGKVWDIKARAPKPRPAECPSNEAIEDMASCLQYDTEREAVQCMTCETMSNFKGCRKPMLEFLDWCEICDDSTVAAEFEMACDLCSRSPKTLFQHHCAPK